MNKAGGVCCPTDGPQKLAGFWELGKGPGLPCKGLCRCGRAQRAALAPVGAGVAQRACRGLGGLHTGGRSYGSTGTDNCSCRGVSVREGVTA